MKSLYYFLILAFILKLVNSQSGMSTMSAFPTTMTLPMTMTLPSTMPTTTVTNCASTCVQPAGMCMPPSMCLCFVPYMGSGCQFHPSHSKISVNKTVPFFDFRRGKYNITIDTLTEYDSNEGIVTQVKFNQSSWTVAKSVVDQNTTYSYTTSLKEFGSTCEYQLNATIISYNFTSTMITYYDTTLYLLSHFIGTCSISDASNRLDFKTKIAIDSYTGVDGSQYQIVMSDDDAIVGRSTTSYAQFSLTDQATYKQTYNGFNDQEISFMVLESIGEYPTDSSFSDSTTGGSSISSSSSQSGGTGSSQSENSNSNSNSNSKSESNSESNSKSESNSQSNSESTNNSNSNSNSKETPSPTTSSNTNTTSTSSSSTSSTGTIKPEETPEPSSSFLLTISYSLTIFFILFSLLI
ncbi:hypothetical protein CYY_000488 [Polysphondylium violaceum]|uniref:EGF-like domain-containing protein n=1 Tax=Polysphondylium violaceum TaxID=133409 RepID=A0A8J4PZP3_9MYCE|nr:hypothetical protein CYY_000488 [Polysphondylium violaceum]